MALRRAVRADVPEILRLIRALAEYEKLSHEVVATEAALAQTLFGERSAAEVVMTGRHAALEPWWHTYTAEDQQRSRALLAAGGVAPDRAFGVLSEGERQQVLLARAVMGDPELLVFDEPAAGLDLGARERLVQRLHDLATDDTQPPIVFV